MWLTRTNPDADALELALVGAAHSTYADSELLRLAELIRDTPLPQPVASPGRALLQQAVAAQQAKLQAGSGVTRAARSTAMGVGAVAGAGLLVASAATGSSPAQIAHDAINKLPILNSGTVHTDVEGDAGARSGTRTTFDGSQVDFGAAGAAATGVSSSTVVEPLGAESDLAGSVEVDAEVSSSPHGDGVGTEVDGGASVDVSAGASLTMPDAGVIVETGGGASAHIGAGADVSLKESGDTASVEADASVEVDAGSVVSPPVLDVELPDVDIKADASLLGAVESGTAISLPGSEASSDVESEASADVDVVGSVSTPDADVGAQFDTETSVDVIVGGSVSESGEELVPGTIVDGSAEAGSTLSIR